MLNNKIKEVSFKLIHKIYPSKIFLLQRFRKHIDTDCSFCSKCPEDNFHLFWSCTFSNSFWNDVSLFISTHIDDSFTLCFENVLFGFTSFTPSKSNQYYIINLIILLAKFHIHKCRYINKNPCFRFFQNETKQYIHTIRNSTNTKAIKTVGLCNVFNVFMWTISCLWPPGKTFYFSVLFVQFSIKFKKKKKNRTPRPITRQIERPITFLTLSDFRSSRKYKDGCFQWYPQATRAFKSWVPKTLSISRRRSQEIKRKNKKETT